jgi:hypothetical protein
MPRRPLDAISRHECWPTASGAAPPCRGICTEIDALELPRLETTLSEAVALGELGFSPALPVVGQAAQEIAALLAELRALDVSHGAVALLGQTLRTSSMRYAHVFNM